MVNWCITYSVLRGKSDIRMKSSLVAACIVGTLWLVGCTSSSNLLPDTSPASNPEAVVTETLDYSVTATETLSSLPSQGTTEALLVSITVTDNNTQIAENRQFVVHYQQVNDSVEFNTILFDIHGSGAPSISGVYRGLVSLYSSKASTSPIVFVYPLGTFVAQSSGASTLAWNLAGGSGSQSESQANDILFIQAIYDYLHTGFQHSDKVQATKIIGIGSSQGSAFLLNRLATQLDFFTGICGRVSQLFDPSDQGYIDLDTGTNRYRVLYFYGYNDPIIPYQGGLSSVGHTFLSVTDSVSQWVSHNQIGNTGTTQSFNSDDFSEPSFKVSGTPTDIFYAYDDALYPVHVYQHNKKHGMPSTINGKAVLSIIWDFFEI